MAKILSVFVFLFLMMVSHKGVGNDLIQSNDPVLQEVDTSSKWENGGIFSLSLAQATLINWAAGGENTFAVNGLIKYFTNYSHRKNSWENVLNVGYGFMKQGNNERYLKTDDKFHVASKYGHRINEFLNYTLLLNFDTQMAIGRNEKDQKIASLLILDKDQTVKTIPLYASEKISKVNFFKSLITSINYLIWGDV